MHAKSDQIGLRVRHLGLDEDHPEVGQEDPQLRVPVHVPGIESRRHVRPQTSEQMTGIVSASPHVSRLVIHFWSRSRSQSLVPNSLSIKQLNSSSLQVLVKYN